MKLGIDKLSLFNFTERSVNTAILESTISKDPEKLKRMALRDKEWGHDPEMTKECQSIGRHYRVCGGCINDLKRKYKNDIKMLAKINLAKKINEEHKKV